MKEYSSPTLKELFDLRALFRVKVRPRGQKFSRTTWYNIVVRHKKCRDSVDGMGDVCLATFYVVRPRS